LGLKCVANSIPSLRNFIRHLRTALCWLGISKQVNNINELNSDDKN